MSGVSELDPDSNWVFGSGSWNAKITHKKTKKENVKELHVLRCWMFSGAGAFSCSLKAVYRGRRIKILHTLIKKIRLKFSIIKFFQP
jgi:hypothetical protein